MLSAWFSRGDDNVAKRGMSNERRFLTRVVIVTVITFVAIYGLELLYGKAAPSVPFFWIQMISGSSWPSWQDASSDSPFLFSLAATVHVMLNIGPLLLVLWVGWTLVLSRRWKMDLAKAFQLRDMDVKLRIKNLVFAKLSPEERKTFSKKLDAIFDAANEELVDDLTIVAGPRAARKASATLEENIT